MLKYFTLLICLASPAIAQSVEDCDWRASAGSLAEPWEDFSRTFANGAIRVALIDVGEPAAGGYHLLVLSPPGDELGFRQCRIVTSSDGIGFAGLGFDGIAASYDPATGLTISIPLATYDPNLGSVFSGDTLWFTINQATGDILTGIE